MPAIAYIGLGSNLDHPRRHLARALADMARLPRTRLLAASRNYLSAPVGGIEPQPDYVNAVAALRTSLGAKALLARLRAIERRHGRRRLPGEARNAPRTLDLDLLLFGRRRSRRAQLTLPHPRMHERAFVLVPLLEVAPAASMPGRGAARRWLRHVCGQRVERTRTHFWR
jgi:2-amino-4-hydroxy-6-hydroxymethyldihydropteridine diphosphokinase